MEWEVRRGVVSSNRLLIELIESHLQKAQVPWHLVRCTMSKENRLFFFFFLSKGACMLLLVCLCVRKDDLGINAAPIALHCLMVKGVQWTMELLLDCYCCRGQRSQYF